MKVVILHTDLRIYWPHRIKELHVFLMQKGFMLEVIEIAGQGSPYAFETGRNNNDQLNWYILFPDKRMEDIPSSTTQKAIKKKLQELNPDILMAGALAFPSGAGALKWKTWSGKPIIIFDDARPEDVKRSLIVNTIKRLLYQNVDAVICPAPSHAAGFSFWGLEKEEIYFGIDVVNNEYFEKKAAESEEKADLTKMPQPYLLAVGRQIKKKNWHGLLEAFGQYKKENPASLLNLLYIGDGPLHQSLVDCAASQLREDIIFVPFVQQEMIVQYLQQARGLILPSRYGETWGLVINEAMAAGLPVLVSKECGCAQTLVIEGQNGWTFDPAIPNEIAETIKKLDQLPQKEWERMGQCSTETIKDWGLPRFTQGVSDAIVYVSNKPKKKSSLLGKLLVHFWNGRYRPV